MEYTAWNHRLFLLRKCCFFVHMFLKSYVIQTSITKPSYVTICIDIGFKTIVLIVKAFIDILS